jgi:hypothetical protein
MQARQILGLETVSRVDPTQLAFEAFQEADSVDKMQCAVTEFPIMTNADFLAIIEQALIQKALSSTFEQRLAWLRQIADEQK